MPSITSRAIVSASGYSKPAIRKAEHHGVDLYELRDWDPATGYEYFKAETVPAARETYGWVGNLEVRLNPHREHTPEERLILNSDPEMVFESSPESKYKLKAWLADIGKLAAKEAASRAGPLPREGRHQKNATVTIQFTDKAFAVRNEQRVPITSVGFSGTLERRVEQLPSVMKALYKLGSVQPIAGCAISDFGGEFGLIALIISDRRTLELARVPIADRNKSKIIGQHLRRRREKMQITAILPSFDAAVPRRDCPPCFPTDSRVCCPLFSGDHLRRPHSALGLPAHAPSRKPAAPLRVRRSSRGLTADRCDSRRTSAYDMLIHQRCSSGPYF